MSMGWLSIVDQPQTGATCRLHTPLVSTQATSPECHPTAISPRPRTLYISFLLQLPIESSSRAIDRITYLVGSIFEVLGGDMNIADHLEDVDYKGIGR